MVEKIVLKLSIFLVLLELSESRHYEFDIKSASLAISSIMNNLHETHHIRFVLALEKNDKYNARLSNEILQHTVAPVELKFVKSHVNM